MKQSLITNYIKGSGGTPLTVGATWEGSGLPPLVSFDFIEVTNDGGTFSAISSGVVLGELELYEDNNGGQWINHIEVQPWAQRRGVATKLVLAAIKEYGKIYASNQLADDDTEVDTRHLTSEGYALVMGLIYKEIMAPGWYRDPVK